MIKDLKKLREIESAEKATELAKSQEKNAELSAQVERMQQEIEKLSAQAASMNALQDAMATRYAQCRCEGDACGYDG